MIRFINVSKRYSSGCNALDQVNLHVARGEMVFLTGHSGAGKSTLLKLVALFERGTQGQILVAGHNLASIPDRRIPFLRRSMGIILQNPHLLPDRTVFDNVALPLIIAGYNYHEIGRRVRAALDKVGLLNKERSYPLSISSGEQQRISIARAIVNKPQLLLADEPTGNLDPELSSEIMQLFGQFNQIGVSVLIASHDLGLIANMKYRVLTLKKGQLVSGASHE
jgi:cell division transport system ATP-binding protein